MGSPRPPRRRTSYAKRKLPDCSAPQVEGLGGGCWGPARGGSRATAEGAGAWSRRDAMALQGRVRDDKARLSYLDDFSEVRRVLEHASPEHAGSRRKFQWLSEQEFQDKLLEKMLDKTTANMEEAAAAALRAVPWTPGGNAGLKVGLTMKELSRTCRRGPSCGRSPS